MSAGVQLCAGTTTAVVLTATPTLLLPACVAGNPIAAFVWAGGTASIVSCEDDVNGNYGAAKRTIVDPTDGYTAASFLKPNGIGGDTTIKPTFNFPTNQYAIIGFCNNGCATSPLDGSSPGAYQAAPGGGADVITTGVSADYSSEPVLCVAVGWSLDTSINGGTGFTGIGGAGGVFAGSSTFGGQFFAQYQYLTSLTGIAATWDVTTGARSMSLALFLDELVAGGGASLLTAESNQGGF